LPMQVLVGKTGNQQERSISRFGEKMRDVVLGRTQWGGEPRYNHREEVSVNYAMILPLP
jgi:hypothetical protein